MIYLTMIASSLSISFLIMTHPLSMGFILLSQTLMIAMITGNMAQSFWYSYIIFIVMVGGMLVLFIYMTSVASNEKFKFSYPVTMIISLTLLTMATLMFTEKMFNYTTIKNSEMKIFSEQDSISLTMSKYLNFPSNMMMIFLIIYLLMALIAVVKITNIKYGPLRQKF